MNKLINRILAPLAGYAAVAAAVFCAPSFAAESVLLQGKERAVTAHDVQADALRIPSESRSLVLSQPETVGRIAGNLYVRRVMADQAQADGMGNDPLTAAALQIARDKILSDAWLARIDRENTPPDAALEKLARSTYAAKPERFKTEEQVQVRHILIADREATGRVQAENILSELKAGADFSALAMEKSSDPGSAPKGGDLGLFGRGRMAPEFEEAAFALKKTGDLSGIVKTEFGYHVIKLQDRRPAGIKTFEEVREQLVQEARSVTQQNARAAAAQRIEEAAALNKETINAFAASQKNKP